MTQPDSTYPIQFSVDYPDKPLNRLTTFFRLLLVIPILVVLGALAGSNINVNDNEWAIGIAGVMFLAPLLTILFRQKYPRWWFDWNVAYTKFEYRVFAYLLFLRDEYPSTDEEQSVHLGVPYPNVETDLNRWLPLVKWLLAIPHYIVLVLLFIVVVAVVVISWFAILFTGRYPRDLFDFVMGVMRWAVRVEFYAFLLTTDHYPPFRLSP